MYTQHLEYLLKLGFSSKQIEMEMISFYLNVTNQKLPEVQDEKF